jgi:hypothetical protein
MRRGLVIPVLALLVVLFLLIANPLFAQQAINGTIRGRISDPSGAAVSGAEVTASNPATGFTRTITTGDDGYYVLPNLPLGTYNVTVKKSGFQSLNASNVALAAGSEAVVDGDLKVGQVETTVEVTGGAPVVEPARTNIGRTISEVETQNLPLTSRNPYNFIVFQPGVSGHPNPELGIPRTLNTNGQLDRINYQMDGMVDTQSDRHGLRLFPISDVYVREVQAVTNSFAPEYGNTTGDIFNVITNSGTNDFHGQFLWAHRWLDATAEPMLSPKTTPKTSLNDYAVNGGGAVIKDKLFLFAGYEHLVRGVASPITISSANATALGIPSSQLGASPGLLHGQFFNIRGDWNINSKNQFFLRYNYFRNEFPINTASSGGGAPAALSSWSDFKDRAHVVGAQLVTTLSPTVLNELRGGWAYRNNLHFPGPETGPGPVVIVNGVAIFNGTNAAGDRFNEKAPNWNDNITWIRRTHTFKFGVSMTQYVDLQRNVSFIQYQFPSVAAYQAAQSGANPFSYSTFSSSQDPVGVHYRSLFWGFYGQDTWQATSKLLLTYGVRYDRYQAPDANPNAPFAFSQHFRTPNGDFAPRLGIAYRLSDKTVVRASAGIFYDAPPTNLWFNSLNQDGSNRTNNVSFSGCTLGAGTTTCSSPAPAGAPAYPSTTFGAATTGTQSITTLTPNFKNAHTFNASLQVSREIGNNDAISLGYVYTTGRQLVYLYDMNLINPTGALADGRPIWSKSVSAATRLYPQFNGITLQNVGATSNYNAMLVTYNHRFSHGLTGQANYTWSHTISGAPDANSFEQNLPITDPTDLKRDRGNSSVNRPHAFTLSTVWQPEVHSENKVAEYLLSNNMFSLLANLSSGDEQNVLANSNLTNDPITGSVQRPAFVGRNTARGPSIWQFDMRYTRTFARIRERITPQFWIESNNLFNHKNVTTLFSTLNTDASGNVTTTPANYLQPRSTVLESRIVQFGLQLRW